MNRLFYILCLFLLVSNVPAYAIGNQQVAQCNIMASRLKNATTVTASDLGQCYQSGQDQDRCITEVLNGCIKDSLCNKQDIKYCNILATEGGGTNQVASLETLKGKMGVCRPTVCMIAATKIDSSLMEKIYQRFVKSMPQDAQCRLENGDLVRTENGQTVSCDNTCARDILDNCIAGKICPAGVKGCEVATRDQANLVSLLTSGDKKCTSPCVTDSRLFTQKTKDLVYGLVIAQQPTPTECVTQIQRADCMKLALCSSGGTADLQVSSALSADLSYCDFKDANDLKLGLAAKCDNYCGQRLGNAENGEWKTALDTLWQQILRSRISIEECVQQNLTRLEGPTTENGCTDPNTTGTTTLSKKISSCGIGSKQDLRMKLLSYTMTGTTKVICNKYPYFD